jgi:hypothetical protein
MRLLFAEYRRMTGILLGSSSEDSYRRERTIMKKVILVLLIAGVAYLVYQHLSAGPKPKVHDVTKAEGAAEFFFEAAMAGDEARLREICTDDNEETLLKLARDLQKAIPADQRNATFRWRLTVSKPGEDQAYTGKIGSVLFAVGLRQVGSEYQVCRILVGG